MKFQKDRLLTLLEANDMTVNDIAAKIKVSRQVIYSWLNGKATPSMKAQLRLCELFKVDMNFFYPSLRKKRLEAVTA
jgi:transcriptional regulator with XRE-family HTH domain